MNKEQLRDGLVKARDVYYCNISRVAQEVGCSTATLSLLINNKVDFNMSEDLRERIQKWLESRKLV